MRRNNFIKLIAGGCGAQAGMLVGVGLLSLVLAFCVVCALSNFAVFGLFQPTADETAPVALDVLPDGGIDIQLGGLGISTVSDAPDPAAAIPNQAPIALAAMSGVNLRSGPGENYSRIGLLPLGGNLEIVGRNADSSWWLVSTTDGQFAWVSAMVVQTAFMNDSLPVVTIPSLLAQPAGSGINPTDSNAFALPPTASPSETVTPAATAIPTEGSRLLASSTVGYKQLADTLLLPPVSESFSPFEDQIAVSEGIKIYVIATDGSFNEVWLQANEELEKFHDVVWSPDGRYIAFTALHKTNCTPGCERVGVINLSEKTINYLEPPAGMVLAGPRWTEDGRLLVNAHPGEPASGETYVYRVETGEGIPASGTFKLSTSHDGQKGTPWIPGKSWEAGVTERPDTYYNDSE